MTWPLRIWHKARYAASWGWHTAGDFFRAMDRLPEHHPQCHHSYATVDPMCSDRPLNDKRYDKPGAGRRQITELRW